MINKITINTTDMSIFDSLTPREIKNGKGNLGVTNENFNLEYETSIMRLSVSAPQTINLVLEILKDVGIGVFSAWLYDKLKGSDSKLRINGKAIKIDKEEIRKNLI